MIIPLFSTAYIPTKLVLDHHQQGMETGWTMNEQWRKHYEEKKEGRHPRPPKLKDRETAELQRFIKKTSQRVNTALIR